MIPDSYRWHLTGVNNDCETSYGENAKSCGEEDNSPLVAKFCCCKDESFTVQRDSEESPWKCVQDSSTTTFCETLELQDISEISEELTELTVIQNKFNEFSRSNEHLRFEEAKKHYVDTRGGWGGWGAVLGSSECVPSTRPTSRASPSRVTTTRPSSIDALSTAHLAR